MRPVLCPSLLVILFVASAPVAAEIGTGYVFPSSANVQGNFGAYFKTRVAIYNPNSFPITVLAQLLTPNGGSPVENIDLSAYGLYTSENFLADEFGYYGGAGFSLIDSTASHLFVVTAEVYTEGPNGRYTTPLTGLLTRDRVPRADESGYARAQALIFNSSNRANFGCTNVDDIATVVSAEFWGRSGAEEVVQTVSLTLPPQGWRQLSVPIKADWLRANFRITSGGGLLGTYCYGVTVNNASNDGTATPAQRVPPAD